MSPKLQNRYLPTPEELARAAAAELAGLLFRRSDLAIPFGIALSGGRIAKPFYQEIVQAVGDRKGLFENVHFFWADERCVAPSDPESNLPVARECLFVPLEIPSENIHRIRGEDSPQWAVKEAEAELCRLMPLNSAGQPVLDLVILGMGEDGHVASLFPAEGAEWIDHPAVYRKVVATKPPPDRITLGYGPIIAAREVWVLASGSGKKQAFGGLIQMDPALPIVRVVAARTRTLVFQDIELLPNPR